MSDSSGQRSGNPQRSLLEPTGNESAERDAVADEPRPGSWFGDIDADGRALTQDETDTLVRRELSLRSSTKDRVEIEGVVGFPRVVVLHRPHIATRQRGGIDSDPMVRLLAFRAWGDRDRRWFEDRGVRTGELLVRHGSHDIVLAWAGEQPIGRALTDARPGELVEYVGVDVDPRVSQPVTRARYPRGRVNDRLRIDPAPSPLAIGPERRLHDRPVDAVARASSPEPSSAHDD